MRALVVVVALVAAVVLWSVPAWGSHPGVCRAYASVLEGSAAKHGYTVVVGESRPYGEAVTRCALAIVSTVIGMWACFVVDVDTSMRVWGKPRTVVCAAPFAHIGRPVAYVPKVGALNV